MKRIVKQSNRVMELFVNVRKKTLRVVEYGNWYVATGWINLEKEDVDSLLRDTDHDILPILRNVHTDIIFPFPRNPYFSSKTRKPLSKWFTI